MYQKKNIIKDSLKVIAFLGMLGFANCTKYGPTIKVGEDITSSYSNPFFGNRVFEIKTPDKETHFYSLNYHDSLRVEKVLIRKPNGDVKTLDSRAELKEAQHTFNYYMAQRNDYLNR